MNVIAFSESPPTSKNPTEPYASRAGEKAARTHPVLLDSAASIQATMSTRVFRVCDTGEPEHGTSAIGLSLQHQPCEEHSHEH